MSVPQIYAVQCEVDSDYKKEFVAWYADRHGPDLVRSGFHTAQMLRNLDADAAYMTLYDAPEHNVFTSDVYAAARAADTVLPVAEGRIGERMTKGRFAHELVAGAARDELPALDSRYLLTLRAEVADGDLEATRSWLTDDAAPRLLEEGATRVWWSRLVSLHNLFPHMVPPNTLVIVEADSASLPVTDVLEATTTEESGAVRFDLQRYERIVRIPA